MDAHTSSVPQLQTCTWIPRKPQKGNEIAPSIYRPHIVTGERLLKWTSPHTQIFWENMSKALPESHLTHLFEVMAFSLNQVTWDGYASGLLCFMQYCDSINIPEVNWMPASEPLFTSFIAFHARKVVSSTIDKLQLACRSSFLAYNQWCSVEWR